MDALHKKPKSCGDDRRAPEETGARRWRTQGSIKKRTNSLLACDRVFCVLVDYLLLTTIDIRGIAMLTPKDWFILNRCKYWMGSKLQGWERENLNFDWSTIVKFTLSLFFLAQNMFKNALIPSFQFCSLICFHLFLSSFQFLSQSSSSSSSMLQRQNRSANSRTAAVRKFRGPECLIQNHF